MNKYHRKIRSFVKREGRLTKGQQHALEQLWPKYGIPDTLTPIHFEQIFGRTAPLVIEIGFGMGDSLLEMAKQKPELNFLGIEVHRPGIGALLLNVEKAKINNVRVMQHDAVEILENCITDESVTKFQIFFPDPWHKKKHHKRRLIQVDFIHLLVKKLISGGQIHCATDWENYASQMLTVLSENKNLTNLFGVKEFAINNNLRPKTKFEKRGQRLGHGVWDLIFVKL